MRRRFLKAGLGRAPGLALALVWGVQGCGTIGGVTEDLIGDPEPRLCLEIEASPRANFYDGQPHVVRLVIHVLEEKVDFEQASESSLLGGVEPEGKVGETLDLRLVPGETLELDRELPETARWVGLVADYYRPPGGMGPPRTRILSAYCDDDAPTRVLLDESEVKLP